MIEVLEQLLEAGKNQEALEIAEGLLKKPKLNGTELLAIQTGLLRARVGLGKYEDAIGVGRTALDLAKELAEWDYHGLACLYLGVANGMLDQSSTAIALFEEYLSHYNLYKEATKHRAAVLYNVGLGYLRAGLDSRHAYQAFAQALEATRVLKWEKIARGIQDAIADQYLKAHRIREVPSILASATVYRLRLDKGVYYQHMYLFQQQLRLRYAALTGRKDRALALALGGVSKSGEDYRNRASYHLHLARLFRSMDLPAEATAQCSAARLCARHVNRSDIEKEAADLMYSLAQSRDLVQEPVQ